MVAPAGRRIDFVSGRHHVGQPGGSKGGLVSVWRGVQDKKIGPVALRGLNEHPKARGLPAHDLVRIGLSAIAPARRRALRVERMLRPACKPERYRSIIPINPSCWPS